MDWMGDMHIVQKKGLYRVTMGKEVEPQHPSKKSKYLNKLDEAYGFMCIHISRESLFQVDGLKKIEGSMDKDQITFWK